MLYMIYSRPEFRARVASLPQLAQFASATDDDLKRQLQDPDVIFQTLDIISLLCIWNSTLLFQLIASCFAVMPFSLRW